MTRVNGASVALAQRNTEGDRSLFDETSAATESTIRDQTSVVLFGMACAFTEPFIELLLATPQVRTAAFVLARPAPVAASSDSFRMRPATIGVSVPVIELSERRALSSDTFLSTLATFDADLFVVACFPWRLPPPVLALPRVASVNVHPSLLPDGRGPEPIFWVFRRDLDRTGVTLHIIDEGLDTGPIVDQRRVAISRDVTMLTLERSLAQLGAEMLREFLLDPSPLFSARPQPGDAGHSAPFPGDGDLLVTTAWTATAAARFIDAVSPVYGSIEVLILATGQRLAVLDVLGIETSAPSMPAVLFRGDHAWIAFADGLLHCRLRTEQRPLTFGF